MSWMHSLKRNVSLSPSSYGRNVSAVELSLSSNKKREICRWENINDGARSLLLLDSKKEVIFDLFSLRAVNDRMLHESH